jgi:predicted nucleotidyltransferase component of viral defense system
MVEKDFYLTRLLWALGQTLGDQLLLKGGTLLSKCDLEFRRMSEDADFVIPRMAHKRKRENTLELNRVRDTLRGISSAVGFRLPFPDGYASDKGGHREWGLPYTSTFGEQEIKLEVSLRPMLRQSRQVELSQLLKDPLVGKYGQAFCFALDKDEARAEKVRAAFTREAGRDFYDLEQLAQAGYDFASEDFVSLVDRKLAELDHPPLRSHSLPFGLTPKRRQALEASIRGELRAVVRVDEPPFDLEKMLEKFARTWGLPSSA